MRNERDVAAWASLEAAAAVAPRPPASRASSLPDASLPMGLNTCSEETRWCASLDAFIFTVCTYLEGAV